VRECVYVCVCACACMRVDIVLKELLLINDRAHPIKKNHCLNFYKVFISTLITNSATGLLQVIHFHFILIKLKVAN